MIKNIKPLQFILSVSLSIALTIIISIFITTAQTSSDSYLKDDLQVKTSAKFNASGTSQVIIDTSGNVKAVGLCIGSDCKTSWYTAGTGISISGTTITNSGDTSTSDDITSLTAGTGISISGTGNTRTITNSGDTSTSDDITSLTAGTGISISGTGNTRTITNIGDINTSDDLTSLTAGTGISISGTGNTRTITNSLTDTNSFGGIYQKYYYYSTYKTCVYKNPMTNDCSCPSGFSASIFADLYGEGVAGAHYYLYQCYK